MSSSLLGAFKVCAFLIPDFIKLDVLINHLNISSNVFLSYSFHFPNSSYIHPCPYPSNLLFSVWKIFKWNLPNIYQFRLVITTTGNESRKKSSHWCTLFWAYVFTSSHTLLLFFHPSINITHPYHPSNVSKHVTHLQEQRKKSYTEW